MNGQQMLYSSLYAIIPRATSISFYCFYYFIYITGFVIANYIRTQLFLSDIAQLSTLNRDLTEQKTLYQVSSTFHIDEYRLHVYTPN